MEREIWKFPIHAQKEQTIQMPAESEIIYVDVQERLGEQPQPCIWALVDPKLDMEDRNILLIGTGHNFDTLGGCFHLGSFQITQATGPLVFHVFERG